MLTITVPKTELFIPTTSSFVNVAEHTLQMEHSLLAMAKWESKWHKPFLRDKPPKTGEEMLDYLKCMTITKNVDPMVYYCLTEDNIKAINEYIENPMTATWFSDKTKKHSHEVLTAEIIYYQMVALQIPFECQKWHLNRLLTLIRVCDEKNAPPKKMSKNDIYSRNRALNAARRAASGSKG